MKSRSVILSLLVLCVVLVPTPSWAKGWYLGGEFQLTSLGDSIVEDIDAGYGFGLDFGYRFSPKAALDFAWTMSFHDEDGNDVEYMRFLGGGKLFVYEPEPWQCYLTLGLESHLIFRSILDDIDGSGFYVGIGGDYALSDNTSLDISLTHSMWEGHIDIPSTSEDVTTDTLSVSYKYHFIK
jgi:opacity protein-like surface antigen